MLRLLRSLLERPRFHQTNSRQSLGRLGEEIACQYLIENGYRVLATGFTAPIGRSRKGRLIYAEIDLIAWDETCTPSTLTIIEVKTRTSDLLARPESSIDRRKQRHIVLVSRIIRRLLRLEGETFRFDAISIICKPGMVPIITHHRDFFRE